MKLSNSKTEQKKRTPHNNTPTPRDFLSSLRIKTFKSLVWSTSDLGDVLQIFNDLSSSPHSYHVISPVCLPKCFSDRISPSLPFLPLHSLHSSCKESLLFPEHVSPHVLLQLASARVLPRLRLVLTWPAHFILRSPDHPLQNATSVTDYSFTQPFFIVVSPPNIKL